MRNFKPSFKLFSLTCVAALALTACNFAPKYERPATKLDAAWPEFNADKANAKSIAGMGWETLYPDARLQALIRMALDKNFDLRLAVARLQEARALWGVQKADQLPSVNAGLTRSGSLTPGGVTPSPVSYGLNSYSAGLNLLSYEVDVWGRVANLSAAAKASYVATEEDRRTIRMGLISDVANAYLQVQELDERTQLAQQTVQTRSQSAALIRAKRDLGAASDLDVLTAEGSLSSAQSDANALDRQRQQAINGLKLLIGGEWPANLPESHPLSAQALPPQLLADVPSQVLLSRPDVRGAEQRLMAANANIGAARAAFFPRIQLTGALGSASPSLSNLFGSGTRSWSFVPNISEPLFDGGRNSANVDVAQARKVAAVASYEKTIQTAFREVADLLAAQTTLQDQLQAQNANAKSQTERLRLIQTRYNLGSANQLELLDAQRDSYNAQQNAVQVLRQLFSTTALLYKALGGGDEARTITAKNP